MSKKIGYELYIGGGFNAQPKHMQKILPQDFLAHFCNVHSYQVGSIVNFANDYGFGGYIYPDKEHSLSEKFQSIQKKYKPIILNLIDNETINYINILKINKALEKTSPSISLRPELNNLHNIEEAFAVYELKSSNPNEQADYKVTQVGAFDIDEKEAHIKIEASTPLNSKSDWFYTRAVNGIAKIHEIYPSDKWRIEPKYLKSIVLKSGSIKFRDKFQPISLEMIFRIGKTEFKKEELAAIWSHKDGDSFIAKRIWDYLNREYVGNKFKLCKICGNLHLGKSKKYCCNPSCQKEWDAKRNKFKYDLKK